MNGFALHPRLRQDCHVLGRFDHSHVLLQRNAVLPWFILVPEVAARELCQVTPALREQVRSELDRLSNWVLETLLCQKLNVAAIGNVVPQLHIHVVGRREGDACWPGVVWGQLRDQAVYSEAQVAAMVEGLRRVPGFRAGDGI